MNARKFTFDTVFSEHLDVASDAARARQKKMLTQGEIDRLLADAHLEGTKAAEVRAQEAIAVGVKEVIAAVRHALTSSSHDIETVRSQSVDIALAAARKLARAALATAPSEEIEAALRDAMHQAIGEPRIVLRASPALADALAHRITDIAHEEGYDGRVQISADPALRGADCRIEWRGGGAERTQAAIDNALSALIARHFSAASQPEE
jgi:flagellar assembly protein FliH